MKKNGTEIMVKLHFLLPKIKKEQFVENKPVMFKYSQ